MRHTDLHSISLIKHKKANDVQFNPTALDEIYETSGSCYENIGASVQLGLLGGHVSATINDNGSQSGAVAKLGSFVENLTGQLTSGGEDKCRNVGSTAAASSSWLGLRQRTIL